MDNVERAQVHEEARKEEEGHHIDRLVDSIIHPKTEAEELAEEAGYKKLTNFEGFLPEGLDDHVYVKDEQAILYFETHPKIADANDCPILPVRVKYIAKVALISGNHVGLLTVDQTSKIDMHVSTKLSESEQKSISLQAIIEKEGYKDQPDWPTFKLREGAQIKGAKILSHELVDGGYKSVGADPYALSAGTYKIYASGRMHVVAQILVTYNLRTYEVNLNETKAVNEEYVASREDAQHAKSASTKITRREPSKLPPLEIPVHFRTEDDVTQTYKDRMQDSYEKLILDRIIENGVDDQLRNALYLDLRSPSAIGNDAIFELGKQAKIHQGLD